MVLSVAALIWCYGLHNHLVAAEKALQASEQRNADLAQKQEVLSARLRATTETLGQSVGLTQKQIEVRTEKIVAAQQAATKAQEAQTAKLEQAQAATEKQVGAVASDVSTVKTDVGGAKAKHRGDADGSAGDQGATATHDWRCGCDERVDCAEQWRA